MPYGMPLSFLLPRLPSYFLGRRRHLGDDIRALFRLVRQVPRIEGAERIPRREPFVAVMNHYHRSDMPAWWLAAAAVLAVGERRASDLPAPTGVMATQWTYEDQFGRAVLVPLSRTMFGRLLRAYDLIGMDPPVLGKVATDQRAHSVRRVVERARKARRQCGVLMIAPQGGDSPDGAMVRPPPGAGRFLLLLAATGLPFLPLATWADGPQIIVSAGEPYRLKDALRTDNHDKGDLDEVVLRVAMGSVAALLPGPLRGYYA